MKTWFTITNKADAAAAEIDIFDEIGLWGVTVKDFATALKAVPMDREIFMRINSPGGMIFDGYAIFNLIAERRARVTAHVIGLAGSMASVIMLAGKKTTAAENATVMIHNPGAFVAGESEEMRKMADLLDKLRGTLVNTYVAKTGKKDTEVIAAMDASTWFTAAEAKAWGLVDEVTERVKIAASFDLTRFGEVPERIKTNALAAISNFGGQSSANKNQPEKVIMKNLLKALADEKLIASADVSEDTAVAQFDAAFSKITGDAEAATARATKAEADLVTANTKIAAQTETAAKASVEAAVKAGKLKDDAKVREKWVAAFTRDAEGTQAMIDGLVAPTATTKKAGTDPVIPAKGADTPELTGLDRTIAAMKRKAAAAN